MIARAVRNVLAEMMTPSPPNERGYRAGSIAAWHALGGYAFGVPILYLLGPAYSWAFPAALTYAYWFAKEIMMDRRSGGTWIDGLRDAAFVGAGLFVLPPALVAVGTLVEAVLRERDYLSSRKDP